MAQKGAAVDRWLKSSFVSRGNISDELYEISQGKFDSRMPFKGLDNPDSVLYAVKKNGIIPLTIVDKS